MPFIYNYVEAEQNNGIMDALGAYVNHDTLQLTNVEEE